MRSSTIKVLILIGIILAGIITYYATPLGQYMTVQAVRDVVAAGGPAAPLVFIALYVLAAVFMVPGTILSAAGGVLFGPYWGFVFVLTGALLGASAAFFVSRYFGRDFVEQKLPQNMLKYKQKIDERGFTAVLYLRLLYFPFNVLNYLAGLTRIAFFTYLLASLIGMAVGTFLLVFFFGTLGDVFAEQGVAGIFTSVQLYLAIALFGLSLTLPLLLKRLGVRV